MLGLYSVEPTMFVCSDFAEYVYVMEKMLSEICKNYHMSRVPCKRIICIIVENSE
jgi:predicted protein tyrosine phosphatase